jgi:L-ascorbate peroxidase
LPEELALPNNRGLEVAVAILNDLQDQLREERKTEVSFADLVALSGAIAVKKCGGPFIPVAFGRQGGRPTSSKINLPKETSALKLTSNFSQRGLTKQDLVALSGRIPLGKASREHRRQPFTDGV